MVPFVVWLNKKEIDQMLSLLSREQLKDQRSELVTQDELFELAKSLLNKNNSLIKIVSKIEPVNPNLSKAMMREKRN